MSRRFHRIRRRARQLARRGLGGAIYGASLTAWGCYFAVYTPFALAFSVCAFILTAVAAGVIALVAGE